MVRRRQSFLEITAKTSLTLRDRRVSYLLSLWSFFQKVLEALLEFMKHLNGERERKNQYHKMDIIIHLL